ncbi:hydrogen peroxide induced protein 1 [Striga asiatica]|uniref:Hydrogen peroxide induced protein 1 n=1 Tax=Striga asiatica TaxID=4170 RepID=A0A5A7PHL2_STRAF|nr:hydrogen peroxide induced protein 1 [Striga asiatica]
MAVKLQIQGLASFGKLLAAQLRSQDPVVISALSLRRAVHVSAYEKNEEDDHVRPTVVPDHVIPTRPNNYWAPHPQTGVFGPVTNEKPASGGESDLHTNASSDSVLEEKAFFRPMEDLEKPVAH